MRTRQRIFVAIWFAAYIATLEFFRFKFGLLKISAAFVLIGIPLMLLFDRTKKLN